MVKPRNDRSQSVTKFCLAMEEHRRTEGGRVRTAREFVAAFFPYDEVNATDKVFNLMPNDVRGPILATWGIRGAKAALKDDDARVKDVVHDALVATDIDEATFEDGVTAQTLIDWVALADWWSFWRQGKLTGVAIQKALATARELALIDNRWFFANIQGRGGRLKGTDVVCDTLSKDQIVAWLRRLHESGDGSPAGLVTALGWDTILAKTSQEALLFTLDAFAKRAGLVEEKPEAKPEEPIIATHAVQASQEVRADVPKGETPNATAATAPNATAPNNLAVAERDRRDSGLPVAIPDIPAIDAGDADAAPPPVAAKSPSWAPDESPRLAEARAKMLEMLGASPPPAPVAPPGEAGWAPSDVPEKPSSLEWPEPPPTASAEPKPAAPPPLPKRP